MCVCVCMHVHMCMHMCVHMHSCTRRCILLTIVLSYCTHLMPSCFSIGQAHYKCPLLLLLLLRALLILQAARVARTWQGQPAIALPQGLKLLLQQVPYRQCHQHVYIYIYPVPFFSCKAQALWVLLVSGSSEMHFKDASELAKLLVEKVPPDFLILLRTIHEFGHNIVCKLEVHEFGHNIVCKLEVQWHEYCSWQHYYHYKGDLVRNGRTEVKPNFYYCTFLWKAKVN